MSLSTHRARPPQKGRPAASRRARPSLESLEGRDLLAPYLVTTTADSGPGSLRQAILDANANLGSDTISFNIQPPGTKTIEPLSRLPAVQGTVVLDGTTQPFNGPQNFQPLIELSGRLSSTANGLVLQTGGSTVRGLAINRFSAAGILVLEGAGRSVLERNFLGTDLAGRSAPGQMEAGVSIMGAKDALVGGTTRGTRNVISGNRAGVAVGNTRAPVTGVRIQGNVIGTDVTGTIRLGNQLIGVYLNGQQDGTLVGGATDGAGNWIAANQNFGVFVSSIAVNTVVQGNFIGVTPAGSSGLGNGVGVNVFGASTLVGGTASGTRNVISGNMQQGVILGAARGRVQGNVIGNSVGAPNGSHGVHVIAASGRDNLIGGTAPGEGNVISYNGGDGVRVETGEGNAILSNAILSNGGLGIRLLTGGNRHQAAPVLTLAASDADQISGRLTSTPSATFTVQVFRSSACDPSGFGEGETYLGSTSLTTNAAGDGTFNFFSSFFAAGDWITATATDLNNNTSEFSACKQAGSII